MVKFWCPDCAKCQGFETVSAWLGEGTILFGGSGFLGPYLLENYPKIISVGRTAPPTPNRHVHVDSLADLHVLRDVPFVKVIYLMKSGR